MSDSKEVSTGELRRCGLSVSSGPAVVATVASTRKGPIDWRMSAGCW